MFDQIGRLAELTATSLSRRNFLTRAGLGAAALFTFVSGGFANPPNKTCVLNGNGCGGAYPYYNVTTGNCCLDSGCSSCCVLNGGGCGGANPYQSVSQAGCCTDKLCSNCDGCVYGGGCCTYSYYRKATNWCFHDSACTFPGGCMKSTCCDNDPNIRNACYQGVCWKDGFCRTRC
jgi:hypothetical protein